MWVRAHILYEHIPCLSNWRFIAIYCTCSCWEMRRLCWTCSLSTHHRWQLYIFIYNLNYKMRAKVRSRCLKTSQGPELLLASCWHGLKSIHVEHVSSSLFYLCSGERREWDAWSVKEEDKEPSKSPLPSLVDGSRSSLPWTAASSVCSGPNDIRLYIWFRSSVNLTREYLTRAWFMTAFARLECGVGPRSFFHSSCCVWTFICFIGII